MSVNCNPEKQKCPTMALPVELKNKQMKGRQKYYHQLLVQMDRRRCGIFGSHPPDNILQLIVLFCTDGVLILFLNIDIEEC